MMVRRQVPRDNVVIIKRYLEVEVMMCDIGTGGGERFSEPAASFGNGVGVEIDPEQARTAEASRELSIALAQREGVE